ncbi:hypothetical protein DCC62_08085 [candidate division KSB1 bacterium]|nr:MAG: hypothetical protein DCC62_08085 [candidate division KSB1 bacterium]
MPEPGPFTTIALTAGLLTEIAAGILRHYLQMLDDTLVGRMLKRVGLVQPNFDERLHDTLNKALRFYFDKYPQRELTGIITFFRDPIVAKQIGGYILDRQPINQVEIDLALDKHLDRETNTKLLIPKRGFKPEQIIPDFIECYRKVLCEQLSVPQMAILLEVVDQTNTLVAEIQASEERMKSYITELLATKLSPAFLGAAYKAGQKELANQLTEEMDATGLIQTNQAVKTIQARLHHLPALFENGLCKGRPLKIAIDEYFISHGLDQDTLADWRQTFIETLAQVSGNQQSLKPYFSGDTLLGGFRLCGISEKLCTTRFSIFLLPPSQDRNVYLELGIAIGIGAPFFLIQHYEAHIPSVLEGLTRYVKGGLFRTMRRELASRIEEYNFGVVRFTTNLPTASNKSEYLIAAGELIEDEDFEASVAEALGNAYSDLKVVSLTERLRTKSESSWILEQLVEAIQASRFAIYRVDESSSPTTFLALGISIGLNRPFLMIHRTGREVPLDIRGMTIYQFNSFVNLKKEIVLRHQLFFERYAK